MNCSLGKHNSSSHDHNDKAAMYLRLASGPRDFVRAAPLAGAILLQRRFVRFAF